MTDLRIPEGWVETPFESLITELRNGVSPRPNLSPPGIPILRISAVRPGSVSLDDFRFLPNAEHFATAYALRDGDLLFTRYNGSLDLLGVCGMVRQLRGRTVLYPDKLMRARVRSDVVLPEFVALFFRCPDAREGLTAKAKSSAGQQGISGGDLKRQPFALAPLPEQRRIVDKAAALLARINTAQERLALVPAILTRLRLAILAAACSGRLTDYWREQHPEITCDVTPTRDVPTPEQDSLPELPDIPETWRLVTVRDVASRMQYGSNKKADALAAGRGVPILRMSNIQDGTIDLRDLKYVRGGGNVNEFTLRRGDVLFNRTNSPELVGKAAVFDADTEMVFASYLVRVAVRADLALPEYVCSWINSPWGRHWARAVRTDGVSQSNINATKLAEMPLPLPPLGEQREIVDRVRKVIELGTTIASRVAAAATRADKLMQSILAEALHGELVPTEAEIARREGRDYEPASALLARLQSQRTVVNRGKRPNRRPSRRTQAKVSPGMRRPARG